MNIKLQDNTSIVLNELHASCERAMEECAMIAESQTKVLCPVDTGNLRSSYTHESDQEHMTVGTDVEYGKYQELGTYKMTAQPHLRPSFERNITQFKSIVEGNLRR